MTAREILQYYWHYDDFRPLQADIINSILSGQDTLALMPTGGGKSLCFQVPTMVLCTQHCPADTDQEPEQGLCLVITPLIALMKDQVENLNQHNIRAAAIYTGMTYDQQKVALDNCQFGPYHFLYISPERLESPDFRKRIVQLPIVLIAVDEAHCVSQWGYDFRPSYLHIAEIRDILPDIPILALTATATPEVANDIQEQLHFRTKNILQKSFHRENLQYIVRYTNEKEEQIIHILRHVAGSAIVYVRNRAQTVEIAKLLCQAGLSADFYHAGLSTTERNEKQNAWKQYNGENTGIRIMVCTNAFGMGIDKPDVRVVIHHDLPDSLEAYYQEAGRGGRDGKTSYAVLLYNTKDKTKAQKRITDNYPPKEFVEKVYNCACDFFQIALGFGYQKSFSLHIDQLCSVMRLPILQTYSALHLLDQAGYIHFEEDHETRPRVLLHITYSQMREYRFDTEHTDVLEYLMRHYPGIFTDLQYINMENIASACHCHIPVHKILAELAQYHILTYIPRTVACTFAMAQDRVESVWLSPKIYEERQQQYSTRLQSMVEYAEQNQFCREQLLLSYFGETEAPICGHCDVCRARTKEKNTEE